MYNKCSYPRFILHPHFLIRVLSSIRIFLSAFYPPSAFSYPRFILHPHFLIRVLSSIRIFSSVFSHPPSVSAIRIRIRIRVLSLPGKSAPFSGMKVPYFHRIEVSFLQNLSVLFGQCPPVSSIYIWSKNFSHSANVKSEAKDGGH